MILSRYGVKHEVCVTVLVIVCSFSLSISHIMLSPERHEMGITLFNSELTIDIKVAKDSKYVFPYHDIRLILNALIVTISCFASWR